LNYIIILKIIIKMDKLKKLIVYRIDGINYIGSTIVSLNIRQSNHISDCYNVKIKHHYNTPLYIHVREKSLQIKLIPIAYYFVSNKSRRYAEQYWINKYYSVNNRLNTINCIYNEKKSNKKFYEKNKEKRKIKQKKYYKKNKKFVNQKQKIKINCPKCNCLISTSNIARHQKSKKCKKLMLLHHQL